MKPENVRPGKFQVHTIIYNNEDFSVAYGKWENNEIRLAMRWNGDSDEEIGYPSQGGNPLWFQLPNDSIWTSSILQAVDRINAFENRIDELDSNL
jgi:hypothetical protein